MSGVRQKAAPDEEREYLGSLNTGTRAKATPAELDEAAGKSTPTSGGDDAPFMSPKGLGGSFLHGAVQGGTLGFGDEFQGAVGTHKELTDRLRNVLTGKPAVDPEENIFGAPGLVDTYRQQRNEARTENNDSEKAHPVAFGLGQLAGSFAVPLPGAGKSTGAARVGKYAAQGALAGGSSALGNSNADLLDDPVGALKDAITGGAIGAPLGVLGGLAGDKLAARGAAAQGAARDNATKLAEKGFASARGALGGETSSAARTLEVLEKAASDPSLPEEVSRGAADFLASPEAASLRAQVARSYVGRGYDQLARIQTARDAMTDAATKLEPGAIDKATSDALSPAAAVKAITSRAKTLGERAIPIAIGGALGGAPGVGAGALVSGVMGKPGTILANAVKNPAINYQFARVGVPVVGAATSAAEQAGGRHQSDVRGALAPYLELLDEKKDGGQ